MASEITAMKHAHSFQNDLFSLPIAEVQMKKRKSKELNPNAPVFKRRKPNDTVYVADPEVITIDSDSDVERAHSSTGEPVIENSDTESVEICEPQNETIEVNDSDDGSLVININQTESVDQIVDSALGRLTKRSLSNTVIVNEESAPKKRIHWTEATGFPKSWTKEMVRFYTEPCERNRFFDYQQILNKLKSNRETFVFEKYNIKVSTFADEVIPHLGKPSDWWINREDMMGPAKGRKSFEMCRKCGKFGHIMRECTRTDVCYICGQSNHMFPNCPNTKCLTCGSSAASNVMRCDKCERAFKKKTLCGICKQNSHEDFMCPSKWRQHLLVDSTKETLRINSKRYCYNCAQEGHFGFECSLTQNSPYPIENPLLTSNVAPIDDQNNNNSVIFISTETADLLASAAGDMFFGRLSRDMNCRIELCRGDQNYVRIVGEEDNVRVFSEELEKLKHNAT